MNDLFNKLYSEALKAYNNAYTPYSHFNVGAAILLDDGNIVAGANVENASYGLTNCAERTTLFYLYSLGYKKENIKVMLIIANSTRPISPCGACRQVMMELMPKDCKVYLTNLKKDIKEVMVKDLLPYSFESEDLDV